MNPFAEKHADAADCASVDFDGPMRGLGSLRQEGKPGIRVRQRVWMRKLVGEVAPDISIVCEPEQRIAIGWSPVADNA